LTFRDDARRSRCVTFLATLILKASNPIVRRFCRGGLLLSTLRIARSASYQWPSIFVRCPLSGDRVPLNPCHRKAKKQSLGKASSAECGCPPVCSVDEGAKSCFDLQPEAQFNPSRRFNGRPRVSFPRRCRARGGQLQLMNSLDKIIGRRAGLRLTFFPT